MKRPLIGLTAPGLAAFAAWQCTLALDDGAYPVALVAVFVLILLGIGVAAGRWALGAIEVLLGSASATAGISAACYLDWSDDTTGLFMVGWAMVTIGAACGAYLVIEGSRTVYAARRANPPG